MSKDREEIEGIEALHKMADDEFLVGDKHAYYLDVAMFINKAVELCKAHYEKEIKELNGQAETLLNNLCMRSDELADLKDYNEQLKQAEDKLKEREGLEQLEYKAVELYFEQELNLAFDQAEKFCSRFGTKPSKDVDYKHIKKLFKKAEKELSIHPQSRWCSFHLSLAFFLANELNKQEG